MKSQTNRPITTKVVLDEIQLNDPWDFDELERLVLASPDPILITGPTGAGKTKLTSRIYDLVQRINRWTYRIPGLAERREDIEPNFEYELRYFKDHVNRGVVITDEARNDDFGTKTPAFSHSRHKRKIASDP